MKKSVIVLLHTGYWLTYFFLFAFLYSITHVLTKNELILDEDLWIILAFVGITGAISFYASYFWLAPRSLAKRKFSKYILGQIIVCIVTGFISTVLANLGIYSIVSFIPEFNMQITLLTGFVILGIINGILATIIKGFIIWYSDIRIKQLLEKRNLEAELSLLKTRLEPHFLFNTINNIDILTEEDAKAASMYLQKLSDIMRFVLYETQFERIPLIKELEYIEKYVALQKIRVNNPKFIQVSIPQNTGDLLIAPMLLIPFIENAFKHVTKRKMDDAIVIKIEISDNLLHFACKNVFDKTTHDKEKPSGLGIELTRQRLGLLYKNRYQLKIQQTEDIFTAECTITLV